MTLFLLPTERRNKIRVRKGKFFDECVGSVSADVSVVCRPTCHVGQRVGGIGFFTFKFSGGACPQTPLEVQAFGPQFYRVPAYSQASALQLQKLMKTLTKNIPIIIIIII